MIMGGKIIKSIMNKRGYRHRRSEEQFSIHGDYARNLRYVYSKEHQQKGGSVVDLVYFAVDILNENLVIGLYRENPQIENGILINTSRSLSLQRFTAENIEKELDRLIPAAKKKL